MDKFKIGDKIFCVDYLNHLGDKDKWLNINMQPFALVAGIYDGHIHGENKSFFSPCFNNIKEAINVPMNHGNIFDQKNGCDIDRQLNRFLHTEQDIGEIKILLNKQVLELTKKNRQDTDRRIISLQEEMNRLHRSSELYVDFCNECKDDIFNML